MSAALHPAAPRVPMEFVGLARCFRSEVQHADTAMEKALVTITMPLRARVRRHPRLRHEQIAQAERLYRSNVPPDFRLGGIEIDRDRAAFRISECRVSPTLMNDGAWRDTTYAEPGVALSTYTMALSDGTFAERWNVQAILSLHCLARHFERTGNRDYAVLVADIAALRGAPLENEKVPTPTGYFWLGNVRPMTGPKQQGPVRSVRTLVIE
jgi:hypothetical protein